MAAIVFAITALLVGITVHEFGHALVSRRLGDPTPELEGRLTLNPIAHIDPFGTVIFPLLLLLSGSSMLFGWAKPVRVNPSFWRHHRRDALLVAVAGPGMNVAAAVVFGLAARLLEPQTGPWQLAIQIVLTNLALAVFNLVPLPPLDGSHVLESLLPVHLLADYEKIKPYGFLILFGLMYLGVFRWIMAPVIWLAARLILG